MSVQTGFQSRIVGRLQSALTSSLVARALFYPTLLWNVVTVGLSQRLKWYNRIDRNVVLGALPFRMITTTLVQKENVGGVISLNEEYEMRMFMYSTEEWNAIGIAHLRLATPDFNNAPSVKKLRDGVDFIKDFDNCDCCVYVHCKAGRGRSATLVACYLMEAYNMSPEQAINMLKSKREQILLGTNQVRAINDFYEDIRARNSIRSSSVSFTTAEEDLKLPDSS